MAKYTDMLGIYQNKNSTLTRMHVKRLVSMILQ